MSIGLVKDGKILGEVVLPSSSPHMGCVTIIGNEIYYIESMPNFDVKLIGYKD